MSGSQIVNSGQCYGVPNGVVNLEMGGLVLQGCASRTYNINTYQTSDCTGSAAGSAGAGVCLYGAGLAITVELSCQGCS